MKNEKLKRLHVGSGEKIIPGWINVDIQNKKADIKADIKDLHSHFNENYFDEIYACHVLEHFGRHEYKDVLKYFHAFLKPNGILKISVPDFHELIKYYFEKGDLDEIRGTLFGGQRDEYDYHKWCHTYDSLKSDLEQIGFRHYMRYDWKNTDHAYIKDWSCDYIPRHDSEGNQLPDHLWEKGQLASLNIVCVK